MNHIRQASKSDLPIIQRIIRQVLAEHGLAAAIDQTEADLGELEGKYQEQGFFGLLTDENDTIIGTLALYPLSQEKAEIRKLYLLPEARGRGEGKRMLQYLIDKAKVLGYKELVLDTAAAFQTAIVLYKRFGFQELIGEGQTKICDKHFVFYLI